MKKVIFLLIGIISIVSISKTFLLNDTEKIPEYSPGHEKTAYKDTLKNQSYKEVLVFNYHCIINDEKVIEDQNNMVVSTSAFESDIQYLLNNNYHSISLSTYIQYLNDPSVLLPDNPYLITFDDGYLNNYENAFPLLQKYKLHAAIFVIGWSVGRETTIIKDKRIIPHFNWEQAREMLNSSHVEFGSHTFDLHNPSGSSIGYENPCGVGIHKMPSETLTEYTVRIYEDLKRSKSELENNLGVLIKAFSYPYGSYNEHIPDILKDLGFQVAFVTDDLSAPKENFLIPRISITQDKRVIDVLKEKQGGSLCPSSSGNK